MQILTFIDIKNPSIKKLLKEDTKIDTYIKLLETAKKDLAVFEAKKDYELTKVPVEQTKQRLELNNEFQLQL